MSLHVEVRGRVAVFTLDDQARRNALTSAMVADIVAACERVEADEAIGAVVVTGAGPAFCSGADVGDLAALAGGAAAEVRGVYEGFLRVLRLGLPTVAAVNGPAVGAGLNLALACDVRFAGSAARFDPRFVQIGLHPGGGHTWLLERAVGPQAAAAMILFGERLTGPRAAEVGLVWRCVADAELLDVAVTFAGRAGEVPRRLAVAAKATLREAPFAASFDAHVSREADRQQWSFAEGWVSERLRRP